MKRFYRIVVSLLLLLPCSAALAGDHNFERTLATGSSPSLSVVTSSGYVHVISGSDNQVHIAAHLRSSGEWLGGNLDRKIDEIVRNAPVRQDGNAIVIGDQRNLELYRNVTIDYEVTAPRNALLDVASGSGDLDIQNVGVTLKAQSGSGSVRARGVRGSVTLGTGSGDVELFQAAPGDVRAHTGSGSIRMHDISGGLRAESGSGDIEITGALTADWKIRTGSGSIRLTVGPQARFALDALTGSGSVRVTQPIVMQGDLGRRHVMGMVNGGGTSLAAQTGSGDIEIH